MKSLPSPTTMTIYLGWFFWLALLVMAGSSYFWKAYNGLPNNGCIHATCVVEEK